MSAKPTRRKLPVAPTPDHNAYGLVQAQRERFLDALRRGLSVTGAANEAGMSRARAYNIAAGDPEFKAAWEDAEEQGVDMLADEVVRRATTGDRPSDILLMFALKAKRPMYRDNFQSRVEVVDNRGAAADELKRLIGNIRERQIAALQQAAPQPLQVIDATAETVEGADQ
jgi:hypothetical protein